MKDGRGEGCQIERRVTASLLTSCLLYVEATRLINELEALCILRCHRPAGLWRHVVPRASPVRSGALDYRIMISKMGGNERAGRHPGR